MEQNRLEFNQTIEELKVQHQRQIDENKVEAENRLSMAQSNLEMQLSIQKVRNEATEKERMANLANMNSEFKKIICASADTSNYFKMNVSRYIDLNVDPFK